MQPLGIWCGAPFGVGYYIWKSLIPTLLGNIVGGTLFVSSAYWYLYLTGEDGIQVTFDIGSLDTAMEAGGPMRNGKDSKSKQRHQSEDGTLVGRDPYSGGEQTPPQDQHTQLPNSGARMVSALGKELSDSSPYAKTHAERTRSNDVEEKV